LDTSSLLPNAIYKGNCLELLEKIPSNSIDLVFADPPYNLQLKKDLWRPNRTKVDTVNDSWDKFDGFAEYDTFTKLWLSACRRVLKDTGAIWVIGTYHNIYRVGAILQDLGFWILNDIVWVKTNPMPNFKGVRFTNAHESLIWAQKNKNSQYTFNHHIMKSINDDLQMRSDWVIPVCSGSERIKINGEKAHSTQKPEELLFRVILSSSNYEDVILDPFFGSGTTGAVAKKLGRNWIGIEQDEKYISVARERIDAVEPLPIESITFPDRRREPRIPFRALLETSLIQPGQILYFARDGITAIALANGHIKCGEMVGSIHGIAKLLLNAPANGWDVWFYENNAGERVSINDLRQHLRK
jgi:site-specific DNA-methyltransferase (adenine-specific)